ncbi:MAG: DUF5683 domain-containing protein [Bacteroidales bacterium]
MWKTDLKKWIGVAIIIMLFSIAGQSVSYSQEPDTTTAQETPADTLDNEYSPRKAALLSAAFPGMGQVYNNKIWKVPIVYVGVGVIYYAYDFNATFYEEYKTAFTRFANGEIQEYKGITSEEGLKRAKDYYRRNRDMNVLIMAGWYLVQIIDATVDAYMFNFDVSEDLSLNIRPTPIQSKNYHVVPGIKFSVNF